MHFFFPRIYTPSGAHSEVAAKLYHLLMNKWIKYVCSFGKCKWGMWHFFLDNSKKKKKTVKKESSISSSEYPQGSVLLFLLLEPVHLEAESSWIKFKDSMATATYQDNLFSPEYFSISVIVYFINLPHIINPYKVVFIFYYKLSYIFTFQVIHIFSWVTKLTTVPDYKST